MIRDFGLVAFGARSGDATKKFKGPQNDKCRFAGPNVYSQLIAPSLDTRV